MDVPSGEGGDGSMHLADFWWKVKIVSITLLWPSKQTHCLYTRIFDCKTLFLDLVMKQESASFQTIMNQQRHSLISFFASVSSMQWWFSSTFTGAQSCELTVLLSSFKRNHCVKVREEGLKDITTSYLIVQTGVIHYSFHDFVQKNFGLIALLFFCNLLCLRQSQLLQLLFCFSILWECRHTLKLLNGQAKNSSGWICMGLIHATVSHSAVP